MLKRFAILVFALVFFILQSQSALACGGLVAPNGAIRLSRATTLVAWHDGIEHYMTSFTYQGDISNLGLDCATARGANEDRGGRRLDAATPLPRDSSATLVYRCCCKASCIGISSADFAAGKG
ncbi:MAG: hypothetical protein NVS4B7_03940 [Ktedonobacteraceae bacterium]